MIKINKYFLLLPLAVFAVQFACNKKSEHTDNGIEGKTSILVDQSLIQIIEDEVSVFENQHNAQITLIPKSEKECLNDFVKGKSKIIVLSRELNKEEQAVFKQKKIVPRLTPFAIDGVVFIKNKKSNDSLLVLSDLIDFLNGKNKIIKGLVFDNPNSSSVRYICKVAGIKELPQEKVYSFKTNEEVIKYVSENDGMIGVVGLNCIVQPKQINKKYIDDLNIMSVKGIDKKNYVYPSQENLGAGIYPLARVLHIINCQGYEGLGIGFSSFIAGDIGQRIVETSGLAPVRIPTINIRIRNQIEKVKK